MDINQLPPEIQARIAKLSDHKKALFVKKIMDATQNAAQRNLPVSASINEQTLSENKLWPLSYSQLLMWFIMLVSGRQKNEMSIRDIIGNIDIEKLEIALQSLVVKNFIFSLKFSPYKPMQKYKKNLKMVMDYYDISQEAPEQQSELLVKEQLMLEDYRFQQPPYIKATLMKLGKQHYRLYLGFSHITIDGQSKHNVWQQLVEQYHALISHATIENNIPNYLNFIQAERNYYQDKIDKMTDFLNQYITDPSFVHMDKKYTIDAENEVTRHKDRVIMSNTLVQKLKIYAANQKLFFEELLMSAYAQSMSEYTANQIFYIQQITRGVFAEAFRSMVGPQLQERLMKLSITPGMSLPEILIQLHQNSLVTLEHISYPFAFGLGQLCLKVNQKSSWLFNVIYKAIYYLINLMPAAHLNREIIKSYLGFIWFCGQQRFWRAMIPKSIRKFFPKKQISEIMLIVNFRHNLEAYDLSEFSETSSENAIKKLNYVDPSVYTAYEEYIVLTVDQTAEGGISFYLESFLKNEVAITILQNMISKLEKLVTA